MGNTIPITGVATGCSRYVAFALVNRGIGRWVMAPWVLTVSTATRHAHKSVDMAAR